MPIEWGKLAMAEITHHLTVIFILPAGVFYNSIQVAGH